MRTRRRFSLEQLQPYLFADSAGAETPTPIEWPTLFGNENPVEIEVGFGKGLFLLTSAMQRPTTNFFGIEVMRNLQLYTATRMAVRGLYNVRVACTDAGPLLRHRIPESSVQTVHVYFPDPWWKKRHRKRRVFTPEFALSVVRILRLGGQLQIASDVEEYFAVMTEIVAALPVLQRAEEPTNPNPECVTNFERKAHEQGRKVQRAIYTKLANEIPVPDANYFLIGH